MAKEFGVIDRVIDKRPEQPGAIDLVQTNQR
jgi:hypothetical protein